MKLQISKNSDINYLSKIVKITEFIKHPNPEVTRLKMCNIDGYNMIVGIDMQPGLYIYFPALSQINPQLLSFLNLYEKSEMNNDTTKKGFFNKNGRVRAIKLKGIVSEGFLIPFSDLNNWLLDSINMELDEPIINLEFNELEHDGKTIWISKKYVVPTKVYTIKNNNNRNKKLKLFNRLIDNQFRFHYDTVVLKKEPYAIQPDDLISITEKIHGTSSIHSNILCYRPLKIWEKVIALFVPGFKRKEYGNIYASRNIIKNKDINPKVTKGFYNCDVWYYANEFLKPYISKGITIYAEIVGYLPNGNYIQKGYDYGCRQPRSDNDYKEGVNFKVRPYRITITNVDGDVHEFSAREVQQWCKSKGLIPVQEYYYGYAKDLYPDLNIEQHWCENFLERLANDKRFNMELNSPSCINKVPHEGIVIKKEDGLSHAWKIKTFKFLGKEQELLDKGISNIEDNS